MLKTASLETSQKLKLAGFPQDTYSYWIFDPSELEHTCIRHGNTRLLDNMYFFCAPTSDEILEVLPKQWNRFILRIQWEILSKSHGQWHVAYWELGHEDEIRGDSFAGDDLIELLASLYLWLKSEGIIK